MTKPTSITIDDVQYVRADSVAVKPNGNRAVVVVDRGWIFAGDITEEDGRIKLSRAVWLFKWSGCGFSRVIEDPSIADIRSIADVDLPLSSEVFRIPVGESWGL